MLRITAITFAAALLATPMIGAQTGSVTLDAPGQVVSLNEGGIEVALLYEIAKDDEMQITATFQKSGAGAAAREVVMWMDDGDSVSFALPGHLGSLYSLSRHGDALTTRVKITEFPDVARTG